MVTKLDIMDIQYMNLFSMITRVNPTDCFEYNTSIVFVVHPKFIRRAIGESGVNVKRISEKTRRKVKIIRAPSQNEPAGESIERFILAIVHPIKFRRLVNNNGDIIIYAGPQSKASLLGRESSRLIELRDILKRYFDVKSLRVV